MAPSGDDGGAAAEGDAAGPMGLARRAALELLEATGQERLDAVLVLGTGLSAVAETLGANGPGVDLLGLAGFHPFTGPGHRSRAWVVELGATRLLVTGGRSHLYEGCAPHEVVHGIRAAVLAGSRTVVLTCSAGTLRPRIPPGRVALIADHLNLTGQSPLAGLVPGRDRPGARAAAGAPALPFVDLTDAWSAALRRRALNLRPDLPEAVYAQLTGPQFETPAEIRMLAALGADLVGMSTAIEAIAARHLGAEVLGLAVASNPAAGLGPPLRPREIEQATGRAAPTVADVVRGVLR